MFRAIVSVFAFTLSLVTLSACSSDSAEDGGANDTGTGDAGVHLDADVEPDSSTGDAGGEGFACDPSLSPIPGGGVGGGRVRGSLTVFVLASETGERLTGATVLAQFGGVDLVATTDASGCVAFRDQRLGGAARVHVFAPDRVYLSLVGFNAAVATVNLALRGGRADPPAATVEGTVTGFNVLTASTATIARLGYVETIPTDVFAVEPEQTRRAENMNVGANVVVVGRSGALDFHDYLLTADAETTAGVAIRAGSIEFPRFGAPTVELTHAGFLLGVDALPGDAVTGKNIAITHPLTESISISYGSSPGLPSFVALGYIVMPGGNGWFSLGGTDERDPSNTVVLDGVPRLDGVLTGATFGAAIQASGDTAFSLLVEPGTSLPHLDVGNLPEPPANIRAEGRAISSLVNASATELVFFGLAVRGQSLWTVAFVNSPPEAAITLPVPPAGHNDPLSGRLDLSVLRIRYQDIRVDGFSFGDLSDAKIRSFAGDSATVTF